ncbi:DUF2779 domain-containing protein [[Mycoplasma] falconis]|uniref:DUF2779 domain-containing protein n=1 Tax=[Mycoplasma] falconis TaxID=92403 RepID=A0A501X9T6_9BACT|nr:DUF2779 domain-containing protein [[Mycoplasma] falconis]TPE57348.1 DUF2779 domain-containing protein [[Mycoplasma] falconis]
MKNNKPKYHTYREFEGLNRMRPYLVFNKNFLENEDESDDEFEESKSDEYSNWDMDFNPVNEIIEQHFINNLDEDQAKKIDTLNSTGEKFLYIKQLYHNDDKFHNKINKEIYEILLSNYEQFKISRTGIELVESRAKTFLNSFYKQKYGLDFAIKTIKAKDKLKDKIEFTLNALKKDCLIINPVFVFENVISKPFYYDSKEKALGILLYSSATKFKNILRAYYDVNVFQKATNIKINKVYLVKPEFVLNRDIQKGEITFGLSEYAKTTKSKFSASSLAKELNQKELVSTASVLELRDKINGKILSCRSKQEAKTIIQHIDENLSSIFDFSADENNFNETSDNKSFSKYKCDFNKFLTKMKQFDLDQWIDAKQLDGNFDSGNDLVDNLGGSDKYYSDLLTYYYPQIENLKEAGKCLIKLLINDVDKSTNASEQFLHPAFANFYNHNKVAISPDIESHEVYLALKEKDAKIVWFDYEGVTLPVPLINYFAGWKQLVCQTSIIKTLNGEIIDSADYIYDPKNYSYLSIIKMIEDLYDKDAKYYVVFNKTYEKSRLLESIEILSEYLKDGSISFDKFNEIKNKVYEIVGNPDQISSNSKISGKLVDLVDLYYLNSKNPYDIKKTPVLIAYNKHRYSIKKIEKFATHFADELGLNIKHIIKPYAELEVKNGSMALQLATARAVPSGIGDNEWLDLTSKLKKYCHNDVLAMIMSFELIEELLKKDKVKYFNNYQELLAESLLTNVKKPKKK